MKMIFIDTNIYLRFFDSNQKGFKKLLDELLKIKENIFITNQIVNETQRNKLNVFEKSIVNYKKKTYYESVFLPEHFAMESNDIDILRWNKKRRENEENCKLLNKELKDIFEENLQNISTSSDYVSEKLKVLFKDRIFETQEEYTKARRRKEVGNPPGKHNDSLGDQISWEQFLNNIKAADEVWIITNDFDYFTSHNKKLYLNSYLYSELILKKPNLKIHCFNTLSDGLASYFKSKPLASQIGIDELLQISQEEKLLNRAPVVSSNIASIGYDSTSAILEVEFNNGSVYQYFDVPPFEYEGLMSSDSQGSFLNQKIKYFYNYLKC